VCVLILTSILIHNKFIEKFEIYISFKNIKIPISEL